MLAPYYNAGIEIVKGTSSRPRFSECSVTTFRQSKKGRGLRPEKITAKATRPLYLDRIRRFLSTVTSALARRVHYSALDHAGVAAVVIL
jgi:hypothetical protein